MLYSTAIYREFIVTITILKMIILLVLLVIITTQTAMKVGPTLAQRRYCRPDVGPTLAQPSLLSGNAADADVAVVTTATTFFH